MPKIKAHREERETDLINELNVFTHPVLIFAEADSMTSSLSPPISALPPQMCDSPAVVLIAATSEAAVS